MDRVSNNESLVTFAVLRILTLFDEINIAKLDLILILCVDRAVRCRLVNYPTYQDCVKKEASYEFALNRKFNEFQPIILNALTLLQMSGLTNIGDNGNIDLSNDGLVLAEKLIKYNNSVVSEVFNAASKARVLFEKTDTRQMYNDLSIIL